MAEVRAGDPQRRGVVYRLPGMDAVRVRSGLEYRADGSGRALTFDLYDPPDAAARAPAVVFAMGFPDPVMQAAVGARLKDTALYTDWAKLAAASGMVGVLYATSDPGKDLGALLGHLAARGESLGIDGNRIGIWACSGHVPTALSACMEGESPSPRCAVLAYGFMLDLDGATHVAEAARSFGFANPSAGRSVADLRSDLALFVVRAGRDRFAHLNDAIDGFVAQASRRNLPLAFQNLPDAQHGFDMLDDDEASREAIRRTLGFLRFHLLGESTPT